MLRKGGVVERGVVAFWHTDEGWGAVKTDSRPGLGFVLFSYITGQSGYRSLEDGEVVEFEWADDFGQDGCQWRVKWVRALRSEQNL
jgi:cold shock CspA family protein